MELVNSERETHEPTETNENEHSEKVARMVSLREAADRTGLSYYQLRKGCLSGKIACVRFGGAKLFVNLDRLVEQLNGGTI